MKLFSIFLDKWDYSPQSHCSCKVFVQYLLHSGATRNAAHVALNRDLCCIWKSHLTFWSRLMEWMANIVQCCDMNMCGMTVRVLCWSVLIVPLYCFQLSQAKAAALLLSCDPLQKSSGYIMQLSQPLWKPSKNKSLSRYESVFLTAPALRCCFETLISLQGSFHICFHDFTRCLWSTHAFVVSFSFFFTGLCCKSLNM